MISLENNSLSFSSLLCRCSLFIIIKIISFWSEGCHHTFTFCIYNVSKCFYFVVSQEYWCLFHLIRWTSKMKCTNFFVMIFILYISFEYNFEFHRHSLFILLSYILYKLHHFLNKLVEICSLDINYSVCFIIYWWSTNSKMRPIDDLQITTSKKIMCWKYFFVCLMWCVGWRINLSMNFQQWIKVMKNHKLSSKHHHFELNGKHLCSHFFIAQNLFSPKKKSNFFSYLLHVIWTHVYLLK